MEKNRVYAVTSLAEKFASAGLDKSKLLKAPAESEVPISSASELEGSVSTPADSSVATSPLASKRGKKKHRHGNTRVKHDGVVRGANEAKAPEAKAEDAAVVGAVLAPAQGHQIIVHKVVPRHVYDIRLNRMIKEARAGVVWQFVLHAQDGSTIIFLVKAAGNDVVFVVTSCTGPTSEVFKPESGEGLATAVYQSEVGRIKTVSEGRKVATDTFRGIVDGILRAEKERMHALLHRKPERTKQEVAPTKPPGESSAVDKQTARPERRSHRNRRGTKKGVVNTPVAAIVAEMLAEANAILAPAESVAVEATPAVVDVAVGGEAQAA